MEPKKTQQTSETSKPTKEQTNFQLSLEEAETLIQYWYDAVEIYEIQEKEALELGDGISSIQFRYYKLAQERLDRLSELLGRDMVAAIIKEHTDGEH